MPLNEWLLFWWIILILIMSFHYFHLILSRCTLTSRMAQENARSKVRIDTTFSFLWYLFSQYQQKKESSTKREKKRKTWRFGVQQSFFFLRSFAAALYTSFTKIVVTIIIIDFKEYKNTTIFAYCSINSHNVFSYWFSHPCLCLISFISTFFSGTKHQS